VSYYLRRYVAKASFISHISQSQEELL
jgi:hypothetical protein